MTVDGWLVSIVEGRKRASDRHDDNAWHDLLFKRSRDQGNHWTPAQVLYSESGPKHGNASVVIGNAAPVVDRVNRVIICVMCRNNSHVLLTRSTTQGATWGKPLDITAQVKPVQNQWGWFASTFSGVQLQHGPHAGRLAICSDHIKGQWAGYPSTMEHSGVILSDDHGVSWRPGASMANASTDECALAETADGTLVINARSCVGAGAAAVKDCGSNNLHPPRDVAHRMLGWSRDGGEHFGRQFLAMDLVDPVVEGSMLAVDNGTRLLFAHPNSMLDRRNMTLFSSTDKGLSWEVVLQIESGGSQYSAMAQ
ncbi:MAG: sialidase family protein, partial [Alphaproteobacteria bacterium]